MQLGQIFLTSRWAMIILVVEATKKAGTPISDNRGKVVTASLVCKEESTKWPVMAA